MFLPFLLKLMFLPNAFVSRAQGGNASSDSSISEELCVSRKEGVAGATAPVV